MTRRAWCAHLALLVPFCARFQGPVALGSLRLFERFRFVGSTTAHVRLAEQTPGEILYQSAYVYGCAPSGALVYRVR